MRQQTVAWWLGRGNKSHLCSGEGSSERLQSLHMSLSRGNWGHTRLQRLWPAEPCCSIQNFFITRCCLGFCDLSAICPSRYKIGRRGYCAHASGLLPGHPVWQIKKLIGGSVRISVPLYSGNGRVFHPVCQDDPHSYFAGQWSTFFPSSLDVDQHALWKSIHSLCSGKSAWRISFPARQLWSVENVLGI